MTAHDKAKLLGLFFWLFTALNVFVVVVLAVFYVAIFGLVFSQVPQNAGDPPPELIISILVVVFAFVLLFTVLFSVPKVVAGFGLRNGKSWARTWAIIASIMCALSFPIGTAIGVFGLVFLFSDEGKRYFDDRVHAHLSPPAPNSWQ